MAAAEAKALLDQLMGGDRDAPLPPGAALPSKRGREGGNGDALLLPGKRHKSCYDRDICPLYCAWGVDVYDLFVNTKSDIGPNPNTPDDAARKEFMNLPQHEKDRLGFEHFLFNKLAELVQQCDRTVSRNNEKLNKELQRQLQKRGGQDYVIDVDEAAVEQLCRNQIMLEDLTKDLENALKRLHELRQTEGNLSKQLEEKAKEKKKEKEIKKEGEREADGGETTTPAEQDDAATDQETVVKQEAAPIKQEVPLKVEETEGSTNQDNENNEAAPMQAESIELGKITLEKQRILCDIANMLSQWGQLQEAVETQSRNLNHVKSDITTDKTVCEVSGNFMSARDADERIAAHYAGKQYVGWKLVRDKFKEMIKKYGKYGPPPPMRGGGPPQHMGPPPRGSRGGFGDRGGGGGGFRDRPNDGFAGGRRGPPPGRWERGGGGGYGRGGGGYGRDRDRGGYGHRGSRSSSYGRR
eukprot:scaffold25800_cov162-Cylindrotheca_fusiformis.AAC.8